MCGLQLGLLSLAPVSADLHCYSREAPSDGEVSTSVQMMWRGTKATRGGAAVDRGRHNGAASESDEIECSDEDNGSSSDKVRDLERRLRIAEG